MVAIGETYLQVLKQSQSVADTSFVTITGMQYTTGSNGFSTGVAIQGSIIFVLDGSVSGYKFSVSPSIPTTLYNVSFRIFSTNTLLRSGVLTFVSDIAGAAAADTYTLLFSACIVGSGGFSTDIQFAQNVADTDNITILEGSYIKIFPFI